MLAKTTESTVTREFVTVNPVSAKPAPVVRVLNGVISPAGVVVATVVVNEVA